MSNPHIHNQIVAALAGRTITEVAAAAGLSRVMVSRYIHGHSDLTTATMTRLVRALGITVQVE